MCRPPAAAYLENFGAAPHTDRARPTRETERAHPHGHAGHHLLTPRPVTTEAHQAAVESASTVWFGETDSHKQSNRGSSAPHESQRKTEDGLVCSCRLTLCARPAAPVPPAPIDAPLRQGARQDGWCYLHGDPVGRPRGGNPTLAWSSQISGMERTRFPRGLLVLTTTNNSIPL